MEIHISVDDSDARRMLERLEPGVVKAVNDAIWRAAEEVARAARRNAPKAFTTLTNSIRAERVTDLHYRVATGVNYARAVEEGRKAGKMPGTANGLMEWVKQKTKLTGKPLDRATFAIARAIGRDGIQARPYMAPAVERQKDRIVALVQAAARRAAQEAQHG